MGPLGNTISIRGPPYKGVDSLYFFSCETNVSLCFEGDVAAREASDLSARMARVDLVEPSPPDLNHKHMLNLQPSISLV